MYIYGDTHVKVGSHAIVCYTTSRVCDRTLHIDRFLPVMWRCSAIDCDLKKSRLKVNFANSDGNGLLFYLETRQCRDFSKTHFKKLDA